MGAFSPTVFLILFLVGLLIAVLWVLMPFAIFGTKPLLRELIVEMRRTRQALEGLQRPATGSAAHGKPPPDHVF